MKSESGNNNYLLLGKHNVFEKEIQWGSEYRTFLIFTWPMSVGAVFKWSLKAGKSVQKLKSENRTGAAI